MEENIVNNEGKVKKLTIVTLDRLYRANRMINDIVPFSAYLKW
jgi:hypothetical protein